MARGFGPGGVLSGKLADFPGFGGGAYPEGSRRPAGDVHGVAKHLGALKIELGSRGGDFRAFWGQVWLARQTWALHLPQSPRAGCARAHPGIQCAPRRAVSLGMPGHILGDWGKRAARVQTYRIIVLGPSWARSRQHFSGPTGLRNVELAPRLSLWAARRLGLGPALRFNPPNTLKNHR